MKPTRLLTLLALLALAPRAGAQEVTIKLGTLAPNGSTWHNLLKEMGEKWSEASGGKVKLKVYAGGTLGNEGDMVRKMGVGQLQAAAITTVDMHEIVKEPQTLSVPMMIDSDDLKRINDTYGHDAGDRLIRAVVAGVRASIKSSDVVARYGGDEFVCIFPGAGAPAAAGIGERIRKHIEETPLRIDGQEVDAQR